MTAGTIKKYGSDEEAKGIVSELFLDQTECRGGDRLKWETGGRINQRLGKEARYSWCLR